MAIDENLHLLIVEETSSDAESVANELRDAGYSITLDHAADLVSLEARLGTRSPDILICGSGPDMPAAASVMALLARKEISAPVIAIADDASEEHVIAARKAGISALVSYDHPEHLHLAFKHETAMAALKQRLSTLTARLQSSEKRTQSLIENSSDAIAYIHDGMHVYANPPYMELFDIRSQSEIEGIPVLDMVSSTQHDIFREFLKREGTDEKNNTLDINCVSPAGEVFSSTMEFSQATMDGEPCTQLLIRVNSGSQSELEKKIRSLTRKDMLTGLWNRQYFMQLLEKHIDSGDGSTGKSALVYLTLDNFKTIREEAGIAASDAVLCDTGNLLSAQASENDFLSRFGDYSFALLKQDTDMESLKTGCEKLLHEIAAHTTNIESHAFSMTASMGICEINRHTIDAQKIVSFADMACEVARTSGGNQIHTHSTIIDESIGTEMEQDGDRIIRETIDNERFYLVFQPIVSLTGDKSEQYEVLLRITDAGGNVILPGQFMSIAEHSGMAGEIDHWVVDRAFSTLSGLDNGTGVTFYIKVTGASVADPEFSGWIGGKLQEYGIDGKSVVIEISERSAICNLNQAAGFTTRMQAQNCRVALEHYGVSDQSALIMQHIPADIFKIDGALIGAMPDDKDTQSKVKSIARSAHEQHCLCIAEQVTDARSLALLWQYGIDSIQGSFVQEPSQALDYEFESEIV